MGSSAQDLARSCFWKAKAAAGRQGIYFAHHLDRMRNAWVAYHAGATWMHPEPDTPFGFASAEEWQDSEVARLADRIQELERELGCGCCNTDSPPCGCCPCARHSDNPPDDWSEADQLRAEVERLRKRWEKAVHFIDYNADSLEDASATLHALAREDGAG